MIHNRNIKRYTPTTAHLPCSFSNQQVNHYHLLKVLCLSFYSLCKYKYAFSSHPLSQQKQCYSHVLDLAFYPSEIFLYWNRQLIHSLFISVQYSTLRLQHDLPNQSLIIEHLGFSEPFAIENIPVIHNFIQPSCLYISRYLFTIIR